MLQSRLYYVYDLEGSEVFPSTRGWKHEDPAGLYVLEKVGSLSPCVGGGEFAFFALRECMYIFPKVFDCFLCLMRDISRRIQQIDWQAGS
jgi:hypothetical protein